MRYRGDGKERLKTSAVISGIQSRDGCKDQAVEEEKRLIVSAQTNSEIR
jgi:hypothetical protein